MDKVFVHRPALWQTGGFRGLQQPDEIQRPETQDRPDKRLVSTTPWMEDLPFVTAESGIVELAGPTERCCQWSRNAHFCARVLTGLYCQFCRQYSRTIGLTVARVF